MRPVWARYPALHGRYPPLRAPPPPSRTRSPERLDVDQPHHEPLAVAPFAVVEQLVDEALASRPPVRQHVLELHEPIQVHSHLLLAQPRLLPQLPPAEAVLLARRP